MISQRPLLAANWKLNPVTAEAAAELARGVLEGGERLSAGVDVVLCPPYCWLLGVAEILHGSRVELGAQNCYWEKSGAYTGEVSAAMLAGWCRWVIVGHSERRSHFGETDDMVARKLAAALDSDLKVIACVGEQADDFDSGRSAATVARQTDALLGVMQIHRLPQLVIAYEPVWAIGSGRSAEPEHAYSTMRVIRQRLRERFDRAATDVRLLYGGSVKAANVAAYVELPNCDGCLIGGASLDALEFSRLLAAVAEVYSGTGDRAAE
ncbi:MAG: triose-phosphate isomerase [Candidatus Dormibacteraeota bacterium]|nr:triose-phosphate isomerase [Candidatus Dormibacteraeota bacterium]